MSNSSSQPHNHALVIGGSIAGLTTARVLTDHFAHVTIIERDQVPDSPTFRTGVPQGRHVHAMLLGGQRVLEAQFPGITAEHRAAGAVPVNMGSEVMIHLLGNWRVRYPSAYTVLGSSRPLLETAVRRHVAAHPRVTIHQGMEAIALCTDESGRHATGVQVRERRSGETRRWEADLIVDASGRTSRAPHWLAGLGFPTPRESVVDARPGYATRLYRAPQPYPHDWKFLYVQPVAPHRTRGGLLGCIEDGQWQVTLVGMAGDHPPTDEAGFLAFARSLPVPHLYEALREAEPVSPIWGYRHAENRLRHYEALPCYLENFLVVGDAVYGFNPVYAQGMTVAAMGSMALDRVLRDRRAGSLDGLAARFQKELMTVIRTPWQLATGEDLRWPLDPTVPAPTRAARLMQGYVTRVLETMLHEPAVSEAFLAVQQMLAAPTRLFHPDVALRVLRARRPSAGRMTAEPPLVQPVRSP